MRDSEPGLVGMAGKHAAGGVAGELKKAAPGATGITVFMRQIRTAAGYQRDRTPAVTAGEDFGAETPPHLRKLHQASCVSANVTSNNAFSHHVW